MKKPKKLKIGILITAIVLLLVSIGTGIFLHFQNEAKIAAMLESRKQAYASLTMEVDPELLAVEYGDDYEVETLVKTYKGDIKKEGTIDTDKIGAQYLRYTLSMDDEYDQHIERRYIYHVNVIDTKDPEIEFKEDVVTVEYGGKFDAKSNIASVKDPVDGELAYAEEEKKNSYTISSKVDVKKAGDYKVKVTAQDNHGRTATATYKVTVEEEPIIINNAPVANTNYPYFIRVNRAMNTVTVYKADDTGKYNVPVTAFPCSTGSVVGYTPLGTFQTSDKYRWGLLFGNVWGQYCTRITGSILFHSVPYFTQNPSDLEYEEYNKLGTAASAGCVRLCVRDVKWIYDNCPAGTTVEIYDDPTNAGPLGKPEAIKIDTSSPNKGWDPTDPDANNPW